MQEAAALQTLEFPRFNFGGNTNVSALGQSTFTPRTCGRTHNIVHKLKNDFSTLMVPVLQVGYEYQPADGSIAAPDVLIFGD